MIKEAIKAMLPKMSMSAARLIGESFTAYQNRRKKANAITKRSLSGQAIHVSCQIIEVAGPKLADGKTGPKIVVKQRLGGTYLRKWRPEESARNGMSKGMKKRLKKALCIFKLQRNGQLKEKRSAL